METEAEVPVSEGEGRCRFEDLRMELEGGPSTLWVDHPEYAFAFLSVDPIQGGEDREIEVILSRGETLVGRVTDWQGKPVSGARVQVRGPDRFGKWHPDLGKTGVTDENGAYRIEHVSVDTLMVVAGQPQSPFVPASSMVAIYESQITRWDVSVQPGGTLAGRVVDGEGYPVKGVGIRIHPVGRFPRNIRTDEDGVYRVEHLSPGKYDVILRTPYDLWHIEGSGIAKSAQVVEGEVARIDMVVEDD